MISLLRNSAIVGLALFIVSCASTGKKNKAGESSTPASMPTAPQEPQPPKETRATGSVRFVTTTLVNDGGIEGNVPSSVLTETLAAMDEMVRKDTENVALATTYLGLLRMYNQNPSLHDSTIRRSGTSGAKNAWFLLEAAYASMARQEFSMADYLLARAQKIGKDNPVARVAIQHATGVRLYLDGKPQAGLYEMKKAAQSDTPFLPSLLTIGFSALRTGDYKTAENMFGAAANLSPNSTAVRIGSAAAMRMQGRASDAIPLLAALYKTNSGDKRIAWNYALTLSEGDQIHQKQALDVLSRTIQLPGNSELDARINTLLTKLQTTASTGAK